jgi:hypothetical protein
MSTYLRLTSRSMQITVEPRLVDLRAFTASGEKSFAGRRCAAPIAAARPPARDR